MSFTDVLKTVFEFALVVFALWSIMNEDKFIAFEEKIACNFRRNKIKIAENRTDSAHNGDNVKITLKI